MYRHNNCTMDARRDRIANCVGSLQEIIEHIFWYLDAQSISRAKKVCRFWNKTIERLERYKHLWRHFCLRDIYRATLIDIIGFNPLSHSITNEPCEGVFEDLWKNVYKSWRAGQYLDLCTKTSLTLANTYNRDGSFRCLVQTGAFIYMLERLQSQYGECRVTIWNIDYSNQVMYCQDLESQKNHIREDYHFSHSRIPTLMFVHLQNPLCKFSQHQELKQHSLIIPFPSGYIQWWAFVNEQFNVVSTLKVQVEFGCMRIWDNMLITVESNIITVFILEKIGDEYNFHARNVSEKLTNLSWVTMQIWDNRLLVKTKSLPVSIAIYGLDDFQQLVVVNCSQNPMSFRMFGDYVLLKDSTTVKTGLLIYNTITGEKLKLTINRNRISHYTLHGDLLIAEQSLLNSMQICRINSSGSIDPVWCSDDSQNRSDNTEREPCTELGLIVDIPKVFESEKGIGSRCMISYGESIVIIKRHAVHSSIVEVQQYVCQ